MAAVLTRTPSADAPYTVAYASFGPLNSAIFIADADGGHERMLISPSARDSNPSMSPDGQWIVFTSRRNGSADIYRARSDGSDLERLTDDPAFDDQAVVSPDGNQLAFVSSRTGQADIWLLDLRTRRLRNLPIIQEVTTVPPGLRTDNRSRSRRTAIRTALAPQRPSSLAARSHHSNPPVST